MFMRLKWKYMATPRGIITINLHCWVLDYAQKFQKHSIATFCLPTITWKYFYIFGWGHYHTISKTKKNNIPITTSCTHHVSPNLIHQCRKHKNSFWTYRVFRVLELLIFSNHQKLLQGWNHEEMSLKSVSEGLNYLECKCTIWGKNSPIHYFEAGSYTGCSWEKIRPLIL